MGRMNAFISRQQPISAIVKKNFSLLLALRYLNPLRTHVSVITLISLAGVATGVMVLIVVLSVFGGFEQLVKDRVLSYTPHILLQRVYPWPSAKEVEAYNAEADRLGKPHYNAESEWRSLEEKMGKLEGIESSYALVNDNVLLERSGAIAPVVMQAIDTTNQSQVAALQKLIDAGVESDASHGVKTSRGSADMGLGECAVISSLTAENFSPPIEVGDIIQIHTSRNLQQIQPILNRFGTDPLAVSQAELLKAIKLEMKKMVRIDGDRELVPIKKLKDIYQNEILPLEDYNLRAGEKEIIENTLVQLENSTGRTTEAPDDSGDYIFEKGNMDKAIAMLDSLKDVDVEKEDNHSFSDMKTVILPKDIEVVGIYQATRHAPGPDIFVPLPVGQDLAGMGDGVRGVALRLDDPYKAQQVMNDVVIPNLPKNNMWTARTWMQDHQQQFSLIKTQRQLLTFSLSFIMLVSAFSIMAVMFTVTIQKKREIGVMKALGAAPFQLVRVFLYQGVIIGFFGGFIGLLLGYLVIKNRQALLDLFASWGFDPFPSDFNGFDGLPAIMRPEEFVGVFCFAFIMCVVATLIPAIAASRSDAAKSLRNM